MEERRSYWAWAASSALHAAMLVLILLGLASAPKFDDSPESIPVETVSLSEVNQIMNGEKDARPAPEPPARPEPQPTPPKPPEPPPDLRAAEEPAPAPPPRPEPPPPQKEEPPRPPPKPAQPPPSKSAENAPKSVENAPEPPERPKAPEKPAKESEKPKPDPIAKTLEREKSEPQPKPARVYDPNAIAKLIGQPKPSATSAASNEGAAAPQGLPHHEAPRMSMSLASALDAWLTESYLNCWTPPPVMPDGDVYVAQIKVVFNADGSLSARPVLLNPPTDPAWRAHAESAMRAVRKCNPLRVPPEYAPYFEEWKVETIHFDPRETQG